MTTTPIESDGQHLAFGEFIAMNTGLRCCPCLDKAIKDGTDPEDVAAAITMAPSMQTFTMGGQQLNAPCTIPVCVDCRKRQMGAVSRTGLALG